MYELHYKLMEKPFQISPDPKFLWLGDKHQEALALLRYGILNNQGFVLLTGDVGTGKTTLINSLIESLKEDVVVATVPDPALEKLEFLNYIAGSFNLQKSFQNKLDFLAEFKIFLKKCVDNKQKVLLIIDEAHKISIEVLEELRLLSNVESYNEKLINIFFVGQNEFNTILTKKECRPLRQRITITYNLQPLTKSETEQYIMHRLKIAGRDHEIFTRRAVKEIYHASKGYPRVINVICDQALLTGYAGSATKITPRIVRECARERMLPGENLKAGHRKTGRNNNQNKKFARRKVVYSCLVIPVFLSGFIMISGNHTDYLANIKSFYGPLIKRVQIDSRIQNTGRVDIPEIARNRPSSTIPKKQEHNRPKSDADHRSKSITTAQEQSNKQNNSDQLLFLQNRDITIPFDYNSNEVPVEAYGKLDRFAEFMIRNPYIKTVIKGYTDTLGSYTYNVRLSRFRANVVASYLVGKGVDPGRISIVGLGEKDPVRPNTTAEGCAANRRVEIQIVDGRE